MGPGIRVDSSRTREGEILALGEEGGAESEAPVAEGAAA
jgi:hypothetical protein